MGKEGLFSFTSQAKSPVSESHTRFEGNKIEKLSIKEGVDFVFKKHPELAQVGTLEEYSKYADSIFPDSKVKDIVYHGSDREFTEFKKPGDAGFNKNKRIGSATADHGIYFTKYMHFAKYAGKNVYPVIVNTQKPYSFTGVTSLAFTNFVRKVFGDTLSKKIFGYTENPLQISHVSVNDEQYKTLTENGHDSINMGEREEMIVFEPEQIHILGNKNDIDGFRKFKERQNIEVADVDQQSNLSKKKLLQSSIDRQKEELLKKEITKELEDFEILNK